MTADRHVESLLNRRRGTRFASEPTRQKERLIFHLALCDSEFVLWAVLPKEELERTRDLQFRNRIYVLD